MSGLPQAPTGALVDALGLTFPESEERFDRLVDAVTEYAIFTLDPDGAITSWNAGAERMKGYTRDEVLGRHFSMLYPNEDRDAGLPQRLLDHARVSGSYQHEGWRIKKDGSRFWGDVVISVLLDDHTCHAGFVKVVRDRSQQHRLEDAQDSFYNAFEHDFKMPITAIKGFAQLIVDADRKDQPYFVERVESNADRLLTIVDELVAYARLRSGLTPVRLQAIDLMSVAQLAVANLTTSAADMSRIHFAAAPPGSGGRRPRGLGTSRGQPRCERTEVLVRAKQHRRPL